ncbi:MAG: hypothetical protein IJG38_07580 [Thermoguttaceae bacterium]|nr:hypothetical protein [Thermoguttaceae bacterium]
MKYGFKKYVNPKPEQIGFWTTKARFVACDCGRGSGKSDIAYNRMLRATLMNWGGSERHLFLVGLPTQDQADQVAMDKLELLYPPGTIERVNMSKHYIDTIFNNRVYVKGMFNANRSEGVQYTGVILDEMSDMPPDILTSLLPAMSHNCRFLFCIGVPKRSGIGSSMYRNICEEWDARMKAGNPSYARFHWTSVGIVPDDVIQRAKEILDDKSFREQYLASWETASGAVYYCYSRENVVEQTPIEPSLPLLIGCDFNVSPMSWVICQAKMNSIGAATDTITVIDELRLYDTNTREALDCLWQKYGSHPGGFRFYGDAAGHQRNTASTSAAPSDYTIIATDKRFYDYSQGGVDLNFPASNPPVFDRVTSVNAMLRSAAGKRRILVNKQCEFLIKDFERVSFKPGTKFIEKSDLELTHMSDALGYLVHAIAPVGYDPQEGFGKPMAL